MASPLILALGGTRSGKSRFGLARTRRLADGGRAWFLATASAGDPELDERIRRHRSERPADWPTIDVGRDLAAAVAATEPGEPILIDGLTLWLATLLGDATPDIDPILDGPVAAAYQAIASRPGPAVVVSDEVGLGIRESQSTPRALSGGQRQRAAIARALAVRPRFLILDEAVAALDVSVQAQILNLLNELRRTEGVGFLFITHNLAVVRYVTDELVVLHRGRVVERGPTERVLSAPEHQYTRNLLAAVPGRGTRKER